MKGKSWRKAGDVLDAVLGDIGLQEGVRKHTALLGWDEIVGEKIGARARPFEIRGKTLFVQVDGSAWMHELTFLKEDIRKRLNERVGGEAAIDQIVFIARGRHGGKGVKGTGRDGLDG